MKIYDAIKQLNAVVGNPSQGLPEELFIFIASVTPMVNVDLLIKDERRRTLLTWRDDSLFPAGWHVPGGIIRYKEKRRDRIAAVAKSELGSEVAFNDVPLAVNEVIYPQLTTRGHFISFLYECKLLTPPCDSLQYESGAPRPGEWAWHDKCPSNLMSVHDMYRKYF